MLLGHQPANVGKEKSTRRVMGVGIGVEVFVMNSVVSRPMNDAILKGDRVEEHQH